MLHGWMEAAMHVLKNLDYLSLVIWPCDKGHAFKRKTRSCEDFFIPFFGLQRKNYEVFFVFGYMLI